MAGQWYYGRKDELFGPFTGWQVADLADAGEVKSTDTVWEDGSEDGVPAHTIPHLFPAAAAAAVATAPAPAAAAVAVEAATWQRPAVAIRRAVAGPGAVIVGQDGKSVRYRKKCKTCGKEDQSTSTATIVRGTMRFGFFCPKCNKRGPVEIHGR